MKNVDLIDNPMWISPAVSGDAQYNTEHHRELHRVQLRYLSEKFMSIIVSRSDDPMQGHVQGVAQRAICFAEALLVELEKVEAGDKMKDPGGEDIEQHMIQGSLFAVFRGQK